MSLFRLFGAFTKVEEQPDGTLIVEGIASSEVRDSQGERVKASAISKAIPGYLRSDGSGPLREMHQPIAAGKTTAIDVQPDGRTYIVTKVVDASTVLKVKEKVLQGFSIGGHVPPGGRNKDDPKVIENLVLTEISLVDRPANPEAVVSLVKLDEAGVTKAAPPAPGQDSKSTNAGGAVQPGPNQPAAAGSTPAPPTPPSGKTEPPTAPSPVQSPPPPTPKEQPPTTIVPPPSSPTAPSPVPGAPATTPAAQPAKPAKKIAKGMYSVSWAAEVISGLSALISDVTWEASFEGDGSTVPARLKAVCTELVAIFQDLVAEETAELLAGMPDAEEPVMLEAVGKPGALKKSERLAAIVRGFVSAAKGEERQAAIKGSVAELTKKLEALVTDELRKSDDPAGELKIAHDAAAKAGEALKKVLVERDSLKKQLEDVTGKLAKANAQLATKGALKVVAVEKGNDGKLPAGDDEKAEDPIEMVKKIHAEGGIPLPALRSR